MHLKMWGHGSPSLVATWLAFLFSMQHHDFSLWCSVTWALYHLAYLETCEWQLSVEWPHFQQFLHCGTPRFIFVPWMVAMYHPTLKQQLMIVMEWFRLKSSLRETIDFSLNFIYSFVFSFLTYLIISFLFFLDNEKDTWLGHITNDVIGLDSNGKG